MMSKILVSILSRIYLFASHPSPDQPKSEDYTDENGIRTTIEYTVNDEGKKIKVRHRWFLSTAWYSHPRNRLQDEFDEPFKSRS